MISERDAVIIDAVRTPIGRKGEPSLRIARMRWQHMY